MKKLFLAFIAFAFIFFASATVTEAGSCLQFNGSLTADNFPPGGSVRVSCAGDNPVGPAGCSGTDWKTVLPNETFTLDNCSCWADECMRVEVVNAPDCSVTSSNFCGLNSNSINAPVTVSCPAAPTPPPACWEDWYCEDWKTPSNVPTSDPNYPKYQECFDKGYYASARKQCDVDSWEVSCVEAPECKIPEASPTPTFTPTPTDTPPSGPPPTDVPPTDIPPTNPPTQPPTAPPTQPPTQPPTAPPSVPPTPTVPPATPTPDFDPAACKCDSMTNTPIIAGQDVTFSAFAKVEGADVSKAKVTSMTFHFGESTTGATGGTALGSSGPIPATISQQSPNKVQYKADWTYKIPTAVAGKTYRAWANIKCDRNAQANTGTSSVLAAEDAKNEPGLLGRFVNFFKGLFGPEQPEAEVAEVATNDDGQISQINLGTVQPGNVTLKTCNMILFEFPDVN